jgi:hypothetical protein
VIAALLVTALLPVALAQEPPPATQSTGVPAAPAAAASVGAPSAPDTGRGEAVRVYVDCTRCDFDFLRTEVTFVNYVRDRQVADVIVFVTSMSTGGGGRIFTVAFLGQGSFERHTDTLTYTTYPTNTPVENRAQFVRTVSQGLMGYAAHSTLAPHLSIRYQPPDAAAPPRQARDPWDYWVYQVNTNGYLSGQSATSDNNFSVGVSANRTTDQWKIGLSAYASRSRSRYDIDSVTTFVSTRESYSGNALVVRSLGGHWSAGASVNVQRSTYSNFALRLRATPALEYDLFPYAQAQRRSLTIRYTAGLEYSRYIEKTLYGVRYEGRPLHALAVSYSVRQPWGNISVSASHSQYLHDLSKLSDGVSAGLSLRVLQGVSFNVNGSYSRVRDQLYLPAAGATAEEIIARQTALATDYRYYVSLGFSYRFGSIYNNVVNPRFGSGGGGDM